MFSVIVSMQVIACKMVVVIKVITPMMEFKIRKLKTIRVIAVK